MMLTHAAVAKRYKRISKVVFKWKMLSRAETLGGMTLWAYSNFEEKKRKSGSR
jgi:hypothetical protein